MGGNAADDPGLYWTDEIVVDPRVERLFRDRLAAGAYPDIDELRCFGSEPWRRWLQSLLTATPLNAVEYGEASVGYTLFTEGEVVAMTDDELVDAVRRSFRRLPT
jgi:hypothetical protein